MEDRSLHVQQDEVISTKSKGKVTGGDLVTYFF